MFTFCCEHKTTDGRRWGTELSAHSWDDAIAQAEFLGLVVSGVLVSQHPMNEDEPVVKYNGEKCPPCPVVLRSHPNVLA